MQDNQGHSLSHDISDFFLKVRKADNQMNA